MSKSISRALPPRRRFVHLRIERFRLELSVLLQQDFYLSFRLLKFLATGSRKLHTLFKQCQRLFQGDVSLFEFLNNFLEPFETLFKFSQRDFAPSLLLF
jgi:hypothetical protein